MIIPIAVVDNDQPDIYAAQLCLWVSEVLSQPGGETSVIALRYQVSEGAPAWQEALNEIIREESAIVFVDNFMPQPGSGMRFIAALRRGGYAGYTYLHTRVQSPTALRRIVESEPRLLQGHGSGAIRKRKKQDVVDKLTDHLRQGEEQKLPPFRVRDSSSFVEIEP